MITNFSSILVPKSPYIIFGGPQGNFSIILVLSKYYAWCSQQYVDQFLRTFGKSVFFFFPLKSPKQT